MKQPPRTPTDPVSRHRLSNGAVLLVKEDPSAPVVSLNFWIEAGSIDERPEERGMAHLIEHMIFKGTRKRGVGEISRQVEAAGGYLNAFTSYEHTCFYVVLPAGALRTALEVEFDAYLHSTFDAGELEKEKEVVFEEMRMRRDDPWSWSWELLFGSLFQKNPYHWPVIGDMDILRKVPRASLMDYYRTHYVPSNTVISVVGDVRTSDVLGWVRRNFEKVRRPAPPKRRFLKDPEPRALRLGLEKGDLQQTYLSLGFPTVALSHPDAPTLEILGAVLGEGASSRLNLNLRESAQSVDEVGCDHFSGKYGGAFTFQALTDKARLETCLEGLMAEAHRIGRQGVGSQELSKVKGRVKAAKIFEKQSVDGQAKTLGFWELQGGTHLEEDFLKALEAVTSEDLQRAAATYLQPARGSLVLYHPKGEIHPSDASHWQRVLERPWKPLSRPKTHGMGSSLKRTVLADGSTLWVKQRKGLPLVSLGVFHPGGFLEEGEGSQGLTQLMTKCLLKGTLEAGHKEFSERIEGLASHLDPVLEKDYWGLTLDGLEQNFPASLDLMTDALFRPSFESDEVVKERKLQAAAIERIKDEPGELSLLESDLMTFAGTPYAHRPLGTQASLKGFTPDRVRSWHRKGISHPGRTWVAVGSLDADSLKAFLDRRLVKGRAGKRTHGAPLLRPLASRTLRLGNEGRQANLVLGIRAPRFGSPDYYDFRVLHTVLNGMGGRLFVELREKKSLAYSVYGSHDAARWAGIYQFHIGCAPSKIEEAREGLATLLERIAKGGITPAEIERARTYLSGLYQVGLQSSRSQMLAYARHGLIGKGPEGMEGFPAAIRRTSQKSVQEAAGRYLGASERTWLFLMPEKDDGKMMETKVPDHPPIGDR